MKKKRVFIISHTHWDREWYMGFEEHHMRLVNLIDDLLYLFKHDPDFDSFHLDGQDIIIDDYLAVRPEKREEVMHYIKEGKLRIGPFYILQDDFLTSPEGNIKNALYGMKKARDYGHQPVNIGYFPDTFGNMGQAPQMMKLLGFDAVAFGRGVTPTGFNNQVGQGKFDSTYSEMNWESPNHDQVLGILFANWYSNGNEIPVDEAEAKAYWTKKLAEAEKFASTRDLLFMNGVDHQPVQMDVTKAIKVANKLFPDYEFIHSNFDDYLKALKEDLPEDLTTVKGELTSQDTDGWYTLANTASSRVYLKQTNIKLERTLENKLAPLFLLKGQVTPTEQDKLDYAWLELLRNHPHDSITGCSVDEVHQGMMNRFRKVAQVAKSLCGEALTAFTDKIKTDGFSEEAKPFVILNTSGVTKHEEAVVKVELFRRLFAEASPEQAYRDAEKFLEDHQQLRVVDQAGNSVPFRVVKRYAAYGYDLPERTFRVPYMAAYVELAVASEIRPFSWQTFAVEFGQGDERSLISGQEASLENDFIRVEVMPNGEIKLFDQRNPEEAYRVHFVDTGDIGNEYIYRQSADKSRIIFNSRIENLRSYQLLQGQKVTFVQTMLLPERAEAKLDYERQAVIDITHRTSARSSMVKPFTIKVTLELNANDHRVKVKVEGDNQHQDHRLRAEITTNQINAHNDSESIFEVVTRDNQVSPNWKNPTNPQHQQAFVSVHEQGKGIVVGNLGLQEYEVAPDGSEIALTLLRCTGELGDWGYFPTFDSQCLGEFEAEFSIGLTDGSQVEQIAAYQVARADQIPLITGQTARHSGEYAPEKTYLTVSNPAFAVTATERSESGEMIVRGYNLTAEKQPLEVKLWDQSAAAIVDFNGNKIDRAQTELDPAEIKTYRYE